MLKHLKSKTLLLPKGETLFYQNDKPIHLYYVETGKIKLIRNTVEGGQVLIHVALSGETFAEASLFSNAYHCSAVADSEAEIMRFDKAEILSSIEQNPTAMQGLLKMFAQQVRDLRAINEIKNIRSAKTRILTFLKNEMNHNNEVHLNMPLKDMAYKIGLSHETFYRELKKLKDEKVLLKKATHLKVL